MPTEKIIKRILGKEDDEPAEEIVENMIGEYEDDKPKRRCSCKK